MYKVFKKYKFLIIYIFIILVICFIPNILLNNNGQDIKEENSLNKYNTTIVNVYIEDKNVKMNIEEYIKGVVAAEMPASYEIEALKAQAVVARTYMYNKINDNKKYGNIQHPGSDICTDINHCQAYVNKETKINQWNENGLNGEGLWSKIDEAVISTSDLVVLYNNEPIKAFFHANSGGKTEDVELVWKGSPIDYLKSVETLGENNYSQYSSNVEYSFEELKKIVKDKYSDFKIDFNDENCIRVLERSSSDRIINIKIGNKEMSGIDARMLFSLKSSNFNVEVKNGKVFFNVIGYGHGVGMSQTGANELAKNGDNYEKIINHYYTNVVIQKIN